MAEKTPQERFRDNLQDIVTLIEKVEGHYESLEELYESCSLAVENEVHLKLLMGLVMKSKR